MKAIVKSLIILCACLTWGITTYYFFPSSIMMAKSNGIIAVIPSIIIQLSCSVNQKICLMFDITTNFHGMKNVPLSLTIQVSIYLIIGVLILLAKSRKKKIVSSE